MFRETPRLHIDLPCTHCLAIPNNLFRQVWYEASRRTSIPQCLDSGGAAQGEPCHSGFEVSCFIVSHGTLKGTQLMGSDPLMLMAQAILRAGMQQARAFTRDWLLPVISPAVRNSSANPEAGEPHANLVHHQSEIGR